MRQLPTRSDPENPLYNVLMIAPTMFFADYGSHVRILEEAVNLRALGHRVTILAYPNGRDVAGLNVLRCWGVPFNYRIVVGSSRHKFYLDAMLGLKGLEAMFKERPDVIHGHLHEGALIGKVLSLLWGVPLVMDFQGSMTGEMVDHHFLKAGSAWFKPFRWLETRIVHWADVIVTSSHNGTDLLSAQFGRANGDVHTISDCVNPEVFRPGLLEPEERARLREEHGIPANAQVVVYLGLLADYQGVPQLIQAARQVLQRHPETYFLLFGWPSIEHYQAMAAAAGVAERVFFPGLVPYEQVPVKLTLGDIAVAPKLSATEGAGKILNYMAMGLPVVAFDTPVSCEYLGNCGTQAAPGDVDQFAQELLFLLDNPVEVRARGEYLRQRILDHFTWRQGAQKIVDVYKKVCPRPRSML
ncbi:MAG: glycosyltransferase family 4 protein [Anaerolineae bacterium]|nr:glycosyltransferase family 4 protein [Anaerolineae bacterium]